MVVPKRYGGEEMKKTMVYVIALTLAFTTLLAGCGEMRGTDGTPATPSATPMQTSLPETMMPNPEDGVVNDRDGIITDNDNGNVTEKPATVPDTTMNPGSMAPATGGTGAAGAAASGMR